MDMQGSWLGVPPSLLEDSSLVYIVRVSRDSAGVKLSCCCIGAGAVKFLASLVIVLCRSDSIEELNLLNLALLLAYTVECAVRLYVERGPFFCNKWNMTLGFHISSRCLCVCVLYVLVLT